MPSPAFFLASTFEPPSSPGAPSDHDEDRGPEPSDSGPDTGPIPPDVPPVEEPPFQHRADLGDVYAPGESEDPTPDTGPDAPAHTPAHAAEPAPEAPVEGSHEASNEPAAPATGPPAPFSLRRVALGFAAVVVLALGSLWVLDSLSNRSSSGDLVFHATRAGEQINRFIDQPDPAGARGELVRRLGWRVEVPEISGATLEGLGFAELLPGISVPVLLYDDDSGADLSVTIVNYAFLDTHKGVLSLDQEILDGIEREGVFVLRGLRGRSVLIWRTGDEIFLAATEDDPEALAGRIATD